MKTFLFKKATPLALALLATLTAQASDFSLDKLPEFKEQIELKEHVGETFYELMTNELKDKMNGKRKNTDNDELLQNGEAVAIRLDSRNFNMHVNYYDNPLSGRSYGWTKGMVGDWSDRAYLTNMIKVSKGSDEELKAFYTAIVQLLGDCDASGLSELKGMSERVATNFLAIYGAEEYRATLGTKNWDDALLEATLLAAFHAGQKTVTKFYMGTFTDRSYKQASGVFNARGPVALQPDESTEKAADLTDYWQFSPNPQRHNSGINETRPDFEKMGEAITSYESDDEDLKAVEKIIGGKGDNVIKDLSRYFAYGQAEAKQTDELAAHVASLMVTIRNDAEKITKSVKQQEK